ncbi:MAG: TetR/AcrR family transcriptional regulator [Cytophagales bacterium]|nr:TetR/AcrR family transcriptional regulator [Cytophagales bacterium]
MDKTREKIVEGYINSVLKSNEPPASVRLFMEELKMKEATFYKYFASFENLEKEFWKSIFDKTVSSIQGQEVYASYSVNEKLLAFYFSWVEELKDYREFVIHTIKNERIYELYPKVFESFKSGFVEFGGDLIKEGIASDEIADRMYITEKYKYLLWCQPVSIIKFWVKDKSEGFEDTDALIEKTVNFSFDLMRSNGIDSFFDLAKFHIQHF